MLYALRSPVALLGLLAAFLLGIVVRGVLQARLGARLGDRSGMGRGRPDPRRHLDPFGAVAAAIGGLGWGHPWERPIGVGRARRRHTVVLLSGPVVLALLGVLLLAAYLGTGGAALLLDAPLGAFVHGEEVLRAENAGQTLLLFAGVELVGMAVLAILPIPPLDGGRLLFLYAPRTRGWQQAEYWLAEQNVGVGVLLVGLILPLAGGDALLVFVVDTIVHPLLSLAT